MFQLGVDIDKKMQEKFQEPSECLAQQHFSYLNEELCQI
jgi:hypothetical protein